MCLDFLTVRRAPELVPVAGMVVFLDGTKPVGGSVATISVLGLLILSLVLFPPASLPFFFFYLLPFPLSLLNHCCLMMFI